MTNSSHVAFDLGAATGRAILGRYDGQALKLEEIVRFPNRPVRLPHGLYWDVLALYREIGDVLGRLSGDPPRSVGIDAWGVDFGLLDRTGALIANPRHYRDGPSREAMERAFERVPRECIYARTGIQFMPINTLYQLIALEATPLLAAAERLLLMPDLLGFWLAGEAFSEVTNASTTQLLDVHSGDWALAMIEELGIRPQLFAPIVESGTVLAPLRQTVIDDAGMSSAPSLVAVASHDTASAVVALPTHQAAYISSGTWSLVGVEVDEPVLNQDAFDANLTNERGFGGRVRLLKNVMGLWLLQECGHAWSGGKPTNYEALTRLAAAAPAGGAVFDPDAPELLAPGDMPAQIRTLCQRLGQRPPDDIGALLRSIFESLACKYRVVIEQVEAASGRRVDVVHVIGGGAQNTLLCSLTASVTGRTVLAGPVEAAATGNLLVQLYAFAELASLSEMRELVRASTHLVTYEPDIALGTSIYERFQNLVLSQAETTNA